MKEYQPIFANKEFLKLWISQILSQFTLNMVNFLLLAKIFDLTHSPIATSMLWATYALPAILVGPFGAALADIVSLRKILMTTNFLQALTILGLFFVQNGTIFTFYGIVLVYSFLNQFYVPAESASLPAIIDKKLLARANSLFYITQQAALVAGFGFGGVIERIIGYDGAIILCALVLFVAFVSVARLKELPVYNKVSKNFEKALNQFIDSIREGYLYIKTNKSILYSLSLLLILQVYLAVIIANLPVVGEQILNVNSNYSGLFVVLPAGIGAFLGAYYVSKRANKKTRKVSLISFGILMGGIGSILLTTANIYFKFEISLLLSQIYIVLIGFGYILASIPTLTFLQEVTPEDIRGRVFGNMWFLVTVLTLIPVLFSGFFVEMFGLRLILTVMSIGCFTLFIYLKKFAQKVIYNEF